MNIARKWAREYTEENVSGGPIFGHEHLCPF